MLDGYDEFEPSFTGGAPHKDAKLSADYDIEGSDLGYRWNARKGFKALFPFGHGLSYTRFATGGLKTDGITASFTVTNTGKREGEAVTQLYLVSRNGQTKQRLVGFQRVKLGSGTTGKVALKIDPRLLADWNGSGWTIPAGSYGFALGENAEMLGPTVMVRIRERRWRD